MRSFLLGFYTSNAGQSDCAHLVTTNVDMDVWDLCRSAFPTNDANVSPEADLVFATESLI